MEPNLEKRISEEETFHRNSAQMHDVIQDDIHGKMNYKSD